MSVHAAPLVGPRDHVVHFYERDGELLPTLARYVGEGLETGGVAVVVATPQHVDGLRTALTAAGVDTPRAEADHRFVVLDAKTALGRLLGPGGPNRACFDAAVGGVVSRAVAGGRPVRAFGEMVGLLWDRGDVAIAIELESLWNDLGAAIPFSLFCAYRLTETSKDIAALEDVCALHSAVLPSAARVHEPGVVEESRSFDAANGVWLARRFVLQTLVQWNDHALVEDAALVVTELAANAVRHARSGFTISICDLGSRVRISVADDSGDLPVRRESSVWDLSGRGLGLVAAVAAGWDVDTSDAGKSVWADLTR